jgi:hypothetical protein
MDINAMAFSDTLYSIEECVLVNYLYLLILMGSTILTNNIT